MIVNKHADQLSTFEQALYKDLGLVRRDGSLVLDSRNGNLENQPLVNFTRSSKKWVWQSGVLIEAAANTLPPSYDPATGERLGWLIEEERTNSLLDSRDMTTGNWAKSATVTRDQVGIDGEPNSACKIEDTDDTTWQYINQNISIVDNGNTHVGSVLIHKSDFTSSTETKIALICTGGTEIVESCTFNLTTGSFVSKGNWEVEDYGDWWWFRGTITNNSTGNITLRFRIYPADDGAEDTGYIVADQAQVELNASFPTSPIITEGSSVTRSADIATIPDVSWFNQSEGTFVIEIQRNENNPDNVIFYQVDDGGSNDRIAYIHDGEDGSNQFITEVADVLSGDITDSFEASRYKSAFTYKENDVAVSVNGRTVITDSSADIPTVTQFHIGSRSGGSNIANTHIKSLSYYPKRLSNEKLKALTL